MNRYYYSDSITNFQNTEPDEILGILARNNDFALEQTQRDAWLEEINILKDVLYQFKGKIYFEYSIPRMGKRIDVLLLIKSVIFVLEFKVGEKDFTQYSIDQVYDYSLDLKNFHKTSHEQFIAPILIPTRAKNSIPFIAMTPLNDKLLEPIKSTVELLGQTIEDVLSFAQGATINQD